MSGVSHTANHLPFEGGDQRNRPDSEIRQEEREQAFDEGQTHSHDNLDSILSLVHGLTKCTEDERSIKNRLAAESQRKEPKDDPETRQVKIDPRRPAQMHGNEPSKGAKIDAEIEAEEEERLREKGIKK
ncbi:hypothetical protein Golomagni_05460 [Golovinomyces magnicellulatus]|nr:hypothetical protein Golomagni_05460 [Golovinomyces magnicellulatus]